MHNLQISTYKNDSHFTRMTLKHRRLLQSYFKSRKGINQTNLRRVITNKICRQFFPPTICSMQENKKLLPTSYLWKCCLCKTPNVAAPVREQGDVIARTTPPYVQLPSDAPARTRFFWFTSNGFLKRPLLLKYWLLRPFSTR